MMQGQVNHVTYETQDLDPQDSETDIIQETTSTERLEVQVKISLFWEWVDNNFQEGHSQNFQSFSEEWNQL